MKYVQSMDHMLVSQLQSYGPYSGRKCKLVARIRNCFLNAKRSATTLIKKEYLRCRIIRGHKRALRQIKSQKIPTRTINSFDPKNPSAVKIWMKLSEVFQRNEDVLCPISQTENGPKTDGKSKRKEKVDSIAKSFNEKFCKEYFTPYGVRESYYYYIELLFVDLNPRILCEKFEFNCCRGAHNLQCLEKWLLMKKYISQYMIEDLGLEPFCPKSLQHYSLPNLFSDENFQLQAIRSSQKNFEFDRGEYETQSFDEIRNFICKQNIEAK
ncbi:unnamed protein product [Blepharisma stoltei]|uniref:Uncharacterized protein n=1 Tax=Blepharisma stoltei TaxID=1481888 RepID=A0AAU9JIY1_9CILI|nr:unnamed protein product [Blepharisma stoltei]